MGNGGLKGETYGVCNVRSSHTWYIILNGDSTLLFFLLNRSLPVRYDWLETSNFRLDGDFSSAPSPPPPNPNFFYLHVSFSCNVHRVLFRSSPGHGLSSMIQREALMTPTPLLCIESRSLTLCTHNMSSLGINHPWRHLVAEKRCWRGGDVI